MSRRFVLERDCYEEGINLYKKKTITINPGVTVLVGCNGIGKTTFLHQVRNTLKKQGIPYIKYDNLNDGGKESISKASFYGDYAFISIAMQSSEGENIVLNIRKLALELKQFIKTGTPKEKGKFEEVFKDLSNDAEDKSREVTSERWILLDAVDSGLSVDNIIDIKEHLFKTILKYNYGNEIYIIVSANEYEIARGESCFDVYNGKYVTFKDYEEYRQFIVNSKEWKEQRHNIFDSRDNKSQLKNVDLEIKSRGLQHIGQMKNN